MINYSSVSKVEMVNSVSFLNTLALSLLASLPWFLSSLGGYASNIGGDLSGSFLCISFSIFIMIFISVKSVKSVKSVSFYGNFYSKLVFNALVLINFIVLVGKFRLAYEYDFQFGLVRHYYFSDLGKLTVFYGSSLCEAFYNKIVIPATIVSFILPTKHKKECFILLSVFLVSSVLVGGRFFIYEITVITVCKELIRGRFISHKLIVLAFLVFFSFFLISIRLGVDIVDSFIYILRQNLNYHVIQLPILADYQNFQQVLAPFVGVETLVYFLFGWTPPETVLAGQIQVMEVYAYNGDGPFNAFATSLAYFFPLFGVEIGTLLFIVSISFFLASLFFIFKVNRLEVIVFFVYIIYFSAFAPFVFSFQFYAYLVFFTLGFVKVSKVNNNINLSLTR